MVKIRHRCSQTRQLIKLLTTVKQCNPQSPEYQERLEKIVDEIVKMRLICRPFQGQPLSGIYQEIYQQMRQHLLSRLPAFLNQFKLPAKFLEGTESNLRNLAKILLDEAIRESLTDQRLTDLARAVKQCERHSQKRQYALNELVQSISLSGKLYCYNTAGFADGFYELLYEEAVNKTLLYVVEKIDNFDFTKGKFMTWVNYRLNRNLYEVRREFEDPYGAKLLRNQRRQVLALKSLTVDCYWLLQKTMLLKQVKAESLLAKIISLFFYVFSCQLSYQSLDQQSLVTLHLANLWEARMNQAEYGNGSKAKGIIDYLEEDPQNIFSSRCIRGRKDANFREIALLKNRDGLTWQELADKFNIRISTLSDFYQRSLEKFKPYFEDFVQ